MKQLNPFKICVICKKSILEDRERWVELRDFDCGIQTGKIYYHTECWRERFKITNSERKQEMYKQGFDAIKNIMGRFGDGGIVMTQ